MRNDTRNQFTRHPLRLSDNPSKINAQTCRFRRTAEPANCPSAAKHAPRHPTDHKKLASSTRSTLSIAITTRVPPRPARRSNAVHRQVRPRQRSGFTAEWCRKRQACHGVDDLHGRLYRSAYGSGQPPHDWQPTGTVCDLLPLLRRRLQLLKLVHVVGLLDEALRLCSSSREVLFFTPAFAPWPLLLCSKNDIFTILPPRHRARRERRLVSGARCSSPRDDGRPPRSVGIGSHSV